MLENFQGESWGSILPLRMPNLLPHDLCHRRSSSCWLLALSHFSCVRLCATPETAAHQAPPSLGFSRQEHWSGLPVLSPMHESESEVAQSYPTLSDPMDCSLPGSSIYGTFQARVLEWVASAFSASKTTDTLRQTKVAHGPVLPRSAVLLFTEHKHAVWGCVTVGQEVLTDSVLSLHFSTTFYL